MIVSDVGQKVEEKYPQTRQVAGLSDPDLIVTGSHTFRKYFGMYGGDDRARTRDLGRDSTNAGSNLLKLRVTDGFFWRSEIPSVTVIGPLSDPRPLPCKPLPKPSPWVSCTGENGEQNWEIESG
jgi:hypothetical protein